MEFDVSPVVIGMVISFIAFAFLSSVAAHVIRKSCAEKAGYEGWVVLAIALVLVDVAMFITWVIFLQRIVSSYL